MNTKTKLLLIKAKKNIFGALSGNNISPKSGDGFDFSELKTYTYGEDVRRIDWKRSAKMNEPYVKLFHIERELNIILVPILCGSLMFGTKKIKFDCVLELMALFAFSALKNADRYSLAYIKNDRFIKTPLCKNSSHLIRFLEENFDLLGMEHNFDKLIYHLKNLKNRSMIIFIGDFFHQAWFEALSKKHEILCVMVRDIFEEQPKSLGLFNAINPSTLSQNEIFFDAKNATKNAQQLAFHDKMLISSFIKQGVRFKKIYSHDNLYAKMRLFLRS